MSGSTYASRVNFIAIYGAAELMGLADRDNDGEEDAGVVDAAIAAANDTIDSHLIAARYTVPLGPEYPTAKLTEIGCQIMRAGLYTNSRPELIQTDLDAAMKYLLALSQGKVKLIAEPETSEVAAATATGTRELVFNAATWDTYKQ